MNKERFKEITARYPSLRIAIVGDYSCDRYLEIDPARAETSIETGLPVHNVTRVRAQPGAAGTILNNLVALNIGELWPVGFCGCDGEGYELRRALEQLPGVQMKHFLQSEEQRTFTYCKPLVMEPGRPPRELNRLDSKNWHPSPRAIQNQLADSIRTLADNVDAFILLDQVDVSETGVITQNLLAAVEEIATAEATIIGDSRRSLKDWPAIDYKMNLTEFQKLTGNSSDPQPAITDLARQKKRRIFVTMAENGIICGNPDGTTNHEPARPVQGEIDIVGAGDAVMANLATALAAEADSKEALQLANAAASVVIHKLGTTGTATVDEIGPLL